LQRLFPRDAGVGNVFVDLLERRCGRGLRGSNLSSRVFAALRPVRPKRAAVRNAQLASTLPMELARPRFRYPDLFFRNLCIGTRVQAPDLDLVAPHLAIGLGRLFQNGTRRIRLAEHRER
jgi:hypothetical protein